MPKVLEQQVETDLSEVLVPIDGSPAGKSLLSMNQLSQDDVYEYLEEASAAERMDDEVKSGDGQASRLLAGYTLKAVMRQPSTRTGGSMTTAMQQLGGSGDLISGMESSSEAKGESLEHTWVAFATQTDILGIRSKEEGGPALAASEIYKTYKRGNLKRNVPVINLGDGRNEHPTQALGDLYTIHKIFQQFEGIKIAIVGDHERYRAFHSLMIGAALVGMSVITVESEVALVPEELERLLGNSLKRVQADELDDVLPEIDILYMGRMPDEYTGENPLEMERSRLLKADYRSWIIDFDRLQQMPKDSIGMHPRPIEFEIHPSTETDRRMKDVQQMQNMIPMRMAILARHLGKSLWESERT